MSILKNTEHHEFIINAYKNRTHTCKQIQNILKVSPNDIYAVLKLYGIPLRGNRLEPDKIDHICELYKAGNTIGYICKITNLGESCVAKYLKINNIVMRNTGQFTRKYELDETIFSKIDTFNKAQFLGMLYADGTVSKSNNLISLRLREDDLPYLEEWRTKLLKTDKPFYYTDRDFMISPMTKKVYKVTQRTAILDITSKKIYKDAINIGLIPNKTYQNIRFPLLDSSLHKAFILGLFEGDGCITYTRSNKAVNFSIACQNNMAEDLFNIFLKWGLTSHVYRNKYISTVNIKRIQDIVKLYHILYDDCEICMIRKRLKFEKILQIFVDNEYNLKQKGKL